MKNALYNSSVYTLFVLLAADKRLQEGEKIMVSNKRRGQMGIGSLPVIMKVGLAAGVLVIVAILIFGILGGSTVTNAVTLQNNSALTNGTQALTNAFYGFIGLIILAISILVLMVAIYVLMQVANIGGQ